MTVTRRERAYYRAFGIDDLIRPHLFPGARVLDVGSSDGSGSAVLKELQVDAVDIHRPSLDAARAAGVRGRCIQADIMALPFADGSYDVVTALDVIEHLPKEGGLALLDELERVCRGQVVVLTPYGFMEQPPYPDQPWMEHKSGWWPSATSPTAATGPSAPVASGSAAATRSTPPSAGVLSARRSGSRACR